MSGEQGGTINHLASPSKRFHRDAEDSPTVPLLPWSGTITGGICVLFLCVALAALMGRRDIHVLAVLGDGAAGQPDALRLEHGG